MTHEFSGGTGGKSGFSLTPMHVLGHLTVKTGSYDDFGGLDAWAIDSPTSGDTGSGMDSLT